MKRLISSVFAAGSALVLAVAAPTMASGLTEDSEDTDPSFATSVAQAQKYVVSDNGTYSFDRDTALADGSSSEVLAMGDAFEDVAASYSAAESGVAARAGFPVWGNWCGPGHGGGKAVDTLDKWCKIHDECYAARGYFDCICDKQLRDGIALDAHKMTAGEKVVAGGIVVYFSITPCIPH